MKFRTRQIANRHRNKEHPKDLSAYCEICDRHFGRKGELKVHIAGVHKEWQFECKYCGQKFSRKVNMEHHERVHTGEMPYGCEQCPYKAKSPAVLLKHRKNIHKIGNKHQDQ